MLGILLIILGIYTFLNPNTALGAVVIIYGLVAIVTGITDIALYVSVERRTGFGSALSLVAGILSIIAGILIFINLAAGAWALTILFPIWFIAHCIARLCNLGVTRMVAGTAAYVVSIITAILGLLLGILLLFNPLASALSMVYIVGLYLVLLGIESIVIAFSKMGA